MLSVDSKGFEDSSGTNKTVTINSSPSISDWSPYQRSNDFDTAFFRAKDNYYGGSFKLDGNGDKLDMGDNEDWSLSNGDFTFRFWMYGTNNSIQTQHVFAKWNSNKEIRAFFEGSASNRYTTFWFQYKTSSTPQDPWVDGGKFDNLPITPNSWNYFVFVNSGGTTSLYVNGASMTPTNNTISGTIYNSTDSLWIGSSGDANAGFAGHIADFEFEKTAISNPTDVPTNKVTKNSNTKLLLQPWHTKTSAGVMSLIDSYAQDETGKSLTYVGNAAVSASSPYKSGDYGSFSFNNTSSLNYIKLAQSSDWTPGTNSPYTIEFWYKTNVNIGTNHPILTTAGWSSNFLNRWQILSSSDKIAMWASNGSGNMFVGATSLTPGKWYHVAVVQDASSNWKLYLNGVQDASGTDSGYTTDSYLEIGANSTLGATYGVKGVIADLRIVKGAALYTADFTPPYAPLTTAGSGTTVLLAQPGKVADSENVAAKDPDAYMKAVIWTGDGSNSRDIPIGFNPDFVWIKNRTGTANSHATFDSVRGFGKKHLWTDLTNGETANEFGHVSGVSNNNITVTAGTSDDTYVNNFGTTYVGWVWKAGGNSNTFNINDTGYSSYDNLQSANSTLPASSTSGMITPTRMSVNTKAGFSIIKWSGNDTAGAIYPHGLSQAPELIITKCTNASVQWIVYSSTVNSTGYLSLPDSFSTSRNSWFINNTQPSNSFITSGYSSGTQNDSSHDYITYCWHSVAGYSAFGSYTGTNHQDKGYRSLDFKPSFILIKDVTSSGNWAMFDNQRGPINPIDHCLLANSAAVETTSTTSSGQNQIDFLSNGFFIRCDNANSKMGNATGNTYIFIAFAETPVPYATAR